MRKKLSFCITVFLTLLLLLTSSPVAALDFNGSTSGNGNGSSGTAAGGYWIFDTWASSSGSTTVMALRFSVYNIYSGEFKGTTKDVYRSAYKAYRSYTKSKNRLNKITLSKSYASIAENDEFNPVTSTSNCPVDSDLGITLPTDTSDIETWADDADNIESVLVSMGVGTIEDLKAGDRIIIEPIFPISLANTVCCFTPSEIALYGAIQFGESAAPTPQVGDQYSWNFISNYSNRHFPNSLYLEKNLVGSNNKTILPKESALTANATFKEIITGGYGVAVISEDPTPGVLKVNFYSNYATESWSGALNTVGASKNVIVRQRDYELDDNLDDGLYNYSASTNGTYLGRDYYTATKYWGTTTSGGTKVHQDTAFDSTLALADTLKSGSSDKLLAGEDVTVNLYAQWRGNRLYINYHSNGASEGTDSCENTPVAGTDVIVRAGYATYGSTYSNGLNNYTKMTNTYGMRRDGYEGTGEWNTKADGTGIVADEDDTTLNTAQKMAEHFGLTLIDGDQTVDIYAQWREYYLKLNTYSNYADASFANPLNEVGADKNVLVRETKIYYDNSYTALADYTYNGAHTFLDRTGYTPTGYWGTEPTGGILVHENDSALTTGQKIAEAFGLDLTYGDAEIDVYPQWNADVLFDVNHDDINPNYFLPDPSLSTEVTHAVDETTGVITLNGTPTKGFSLSSTRGLDITEGDTYKLTMTYVGGSYSGSASFVFDFLDLDTREFMSIAAPPTASNPVQTRTVTASSAAEAASYGFKTWVYKSSDPSFDNYQFTLKVEKADATTEYSPNGKSIPEGSNYGTLPTAEREGYVLSGWYTEPDGGTEVTADTSFYDTKALTLYALWERSEYIVHYDANGAEGTMPDQTIKMDEEFTVAENEFTLNGNVSPGYNLYRPEDEKWLTEDGWFVEADILANDYTLILFEEESDQTMDRSWIEGLEEATEFTMVAQWELAKYNVSYHSNGGTGSIPNLDVAYGTKFTVADNQFTRGGYDFTGFYLKRVEDQKWFTFSGWATDEEILANNYIKWMYRPGDECTMSDEWIDGLFGQSQFTFYAQWEAKEPTVTTTAARLRFIKLQYLYTLEGTKWEEGTELGNYLKEVLERDPSINENCQQVWVFEPEDFEEVHEWCLEHEKGTETNKAFLEKFKDNRIYYNPDN